MKKQRTWLWGLNLSLRNRVVVGGRSFGSSVSSSRNLGQSCLFQNIARGNTFMQAKLAGYQARSRFLATLHTSFPFLLIMWTETPVSSIIYGIAIIVYVPGIGWGVVRTLPHLTQEAIMWAVSIPNLLRMKLGLRLVQEWARDPRLLNDRSGMSTRPVGVKNACFPIPLRGLPLCA